MAVVIQDFEVDNSPANDDASGHAATTRSGETEGRPGEPSPAELRRALRRQAERLARLHAD